MRRRLARASRERVDNVLRRPDLRVPAPEVNERLNHLNEALNSGIALKRRIIEDLRPSALGHLGLVVSLGILTREFAQLAPQDAQSTKVDVVYERTALTSGGDERVRRAAAHDQQAGPEWSSQIDAYLKSAMLTR